jgi:hypothetical protein
MFATLEWCFRALSLADKQRLLAILEAIEMEKPEEEPRVLN